MVANQFLKHDYDYIISKLRYRKRACNSSESSASGYLCRFQIRLLQLTYVWFRLNYYGTG